LDLSPGGGGEGEGPGKGEAGTHDRAGHRLPPAPIAAPRAPVKPNGWRRIMPSRAGNAKRLSRSRGRWALRSAARYAPPPARAPQRSSDTLPGSSRACSSGLSDVLRMSPDPPGARCEPSETGREQKERAHEPPGAPRGGATPPATLREA